MSHGGELFGITYQKSEVIFHQGDFGDTMFIIQSGAIEISQSQNSHKNILALLEKGAFFGEMAIITDHPRTADAIAVNQTVLLPVQKNEFLDRIKTEPEMALYILQGLIGRCVRIFDPCLSCATH